MLKRLFFIPLVFLGLSSLAHATCNEVIDELNVKSLNFEVSRFNGDYKISLQFPNLKNSECKIQTESGVARRAVFHFKPGNGIKINIAHKVVAGIGQDDEILAADIDLFESRLHVSRTGHKKIIDGVSAYLKYDFEKSDYALSVFQAFRETKTDSTVVLY